MTKYRVLSIILLLFLTIILTLQLIGPSESWLHTSTVESDTVWNSSTSGLLILTPTAAICEELFNYGRQLAESHPEISHATLPDDFLKKRSAMHTTLSTLDFQKNFDTFIIVPAIPGTAESFIRMASLKPDSKLIAICPMESETEYRKGHIRLMGTRSQLNTPEDVIQECIDTLEQIGYERKGGKLFITFSDNPASDEPDQQ